MPNRAAICGMRDDASRTAAKQCLVRLGRDRGGRDLEVDGRERQGVDDGGPTRGCRLTGEGGGGRLGEAIGLRSAGSGSARLGRPGGQAEGAHDPAFGQVAGDLGQPVRLLLVDPAGQALAQRVGQRAGVVVLGRRVGCDDDRAQVTQVEFVEVGQCRRPRGRATQRCASGGAGARPGRPAGRTSPRSCLRREPARSAWPRRHGPPGCRPSAPARRWAGVRAAARRGRPSGAPVRRGGASGVGGSPRRGVRRTRTARPRGRPIGCGRTRLSAVGPGATAITGGALADRRAVAGRSVAGRRSPPGRAPPRSLRSPRGRRSPRSGRSPRSPRSPRSSRRPRPFGASVVVTHSEGSARPSSSMRSGSLRAPFGGKTASTSVPSRPVSMSAR